MSRRFQLHVVLREGTHYAPTEMDVTVVKEAVEKVARDLKIEAEVHVEEIRPMLWTGGR